MSSSIASDAPNLLRMRLTGLVAAMALTLTVSSCTGSDSPESTMPEKQQGRETPRAEPAGYPAPDPADPDQLAASISEAHRAIIDAGTSKDDVQRAGEFEQLAARELGRAPRKQAAAVIELVEPQGARYATRQNVAASRELQGLATPQKTFPDEWEIHDPRPPGELLGYYRRAEGSTGIGWEYLAAINLVETRMGRIIGTSTAGAQGPMQFITDTWKQYGDGGDVNDPRDATLAAGRLLSANGGPKNMSGALWSYNQSQHYVRSVTAHAKVMEREPRAYRSYHAWRVLYNHRSGTYVMPVGYPETSPELLPQD